jgi:hypothetical protein
MPHINELKKSSFLKKEDCGDRGILVTIKEVVQENVAKDGSPEELKWCVFFKECDKPMVLNSINCQLIASITKQENTDNWPGHKVVLYNDPAISYQGKITGGIRVRAPRGAAAQPAANPAPAPVAPVEDDSSVPFWSDAMKALSLEVQLTSASTRADGSLGLRLATPELKPEEKTAVFELQGKNLKMLLQPMDEAPEAFVEVKQELEFKTPSARLRAVMFVAWKQEPDPKDGFDLYYGQKMESIINHIKSKLQPVW